MTIREQLHDLDALLGKSPAGHRVAFNHWWELLNAEWDGDLPDNSIPSRWGRPGFLALATDALKRDDEPRFREICLRALYWEQFRMKEEQ